ncbi:GNAT family N-acetyltransferase [Aquisphaera insulae]|uniref:GNAT family N-acetyltransferase n=1 Tax=Aquisphaera insulae TaxID=2712864 RepID=UPI0013EC8147|nr:GNAT family N-acetyltransferase [Aquisphaera insulae]
MVDWIVEPLAGVHDRSGFSCGRPVLDDFLRLRAGQYESRKLGKTFVAMAPGETRVIGYYTLAAGSIDYANLPPKASRKLPSHPVPVVLLARLAVDQSAQGKGLGQGLLFDALQRSLNLSANLGVHAIVVDALDDAAIHFYAHHEFTPLLDDPRHLYLPMATVAKLLR